MVIHKWAAIKLSLKVSNSIETMSLGDEAAAAATRYNRRPVVGGAPAKIEETPATQESQTEETSSTSTEE